MAKTNFTKVEEALAEGMRKLTIDKLHEIVDDKGEQSSKSTRDKEKTQLLQSVNLDLKYLIKTGIDPYTTFSLDKEQFKKFFDDPKAMTALDWIKVKETRKTLDDHKAKMKESEKGKEEELIEQERKDQKTKRYNIRKNWLPLQ
jgi:hypothetical protein